LPITSNCKDTLSEEKEGKAVVRNGGCTDNKRAISKPLSQENDHGAFPTKQMMLGNRGNVPEGSKSEDYRGHKNSAGKKKSASKEKGAQRLGPSRFYGGSPTQGGKRP